MTREEVKAKRDEYRLAIKRLQRDIEKVRLDWKGLQEDCSHPHIRRYTDISGVGCTSCDDCGYSD